MLTLSPSDTNTESMFGCVFCGDKILADVAVNVILYAPLGIGLALVRPRRWQVLLLGIGLSTTVEATQVLLPGRDGSLGDIIANTAGVGIGALLVGSSAFWLRPSRRTSNSLGLAATILAVSSFMLTGFLLTPSLPTGAYSVVWTPTESGRPRYGGAVVRASVGDISLRPMRIENTDSIRGLLANGAHVTAQIVVGPRPRKSTALVLVRDELMRKVFALAADRQDIVISYRTRAADMWFDQPDMRVDWPPHLTDGDSLQIDMWRTETGRCIELNQTSQCQVGFSVGHGWSLLFYSPSFPRWLSALFSAAWVAGFFGLVAFWTRHSGLAVVTVGSMGVVLGLAPAFTELVRTPLAQWIGAAIGVVAGVGLRAMMRRFWNRPL